MGASSAQSPIRFCLASSSAFEYSGDDSDFGQLNVSFNHFESKKAKPFLASPSI